MRTVTIERTYFTVRELQAHNGGGFVRALDEYARKECEWADFSDEWASLHALDKITGWQRRDYHGANWSDVWDMSGRRAWAWLENVVLSDLRIPWQGHRRRDVARYMKAYPKGSTAYRPGTVEPCPLTGYYTDEVLLDALRDGIRVGSDLRQVMHELEHVIATLCDEELDYRTSEEAFIERAEEEGWEFLADGSQV